MPELLEVEIISSSLHCRIIGKFISAIDFLDDNYRISRRLVELIGSEVVGVY